MPKIRKLGRYAACIIFVALCFIGFELRLVQWQIVDGEKYQQISLSTRTDAIDLEAARGEILDRNGKVLAGNRTSYNIVYNALHMDYAKRNATIIQILDLLEERGEKWRDRLPILLDGEGNYAFDESREEDVAQLKENLGLADYATADDCILELQDTYGCQGFSKEDTRKVASVRYSMTRDGYSRTRPYVIAEDVSAETVGIISERESQWPGIEPRVAVTRYYGEDGSLAPHIVGQVGSINSEQYQQAVEDGAAYDSEDNLSGYTWTDTLGVDGLEAAFEEELRGSRGRETIFTDEMGEVQSTAVTVQPVEGHTVHTTLDGDLQRAANLSLRRNIEGNTQAKGCVAGAAVVLDVDDFGVLACSTYPTFDMNLYTTDDKYVSEMNNDKARRPMFNRALNGVFTPGSVFKPMVALAALQEGVITAETTYDCSGWFKYYDMDLKCLNDILGPKNVYSALAESCNVYFCNVGLNLTIRKMDAYAEYFGLGEKTGVELYEDVGVMSNPQEYLDRHGVSWTDGVSAHAAIGQADSQFTPMQLAAYCATMANGGVRLQTHFLDKITDYTGKETVRQYEPKQLYDAGLSSDVQNVVREGMMGTASYGNASSVFEDYPIAIACKTGTAETSDDPSTGTEANLSFICYAPADDPQIAVAVMLEYGNKGTYAQNVAKDILDQYFGFYTWDEEGNRYNQAGDLVDDEGKVLKTKAQLDEEKAAKKGNGSEASSGSNSASDADGSDVSSVPSREDIPASPFTGSSAPESSGDSGASSQPETNHVPKDSPYLDDEEESGQSS